MACASDFCRLNLSSALPEIFYDFVFNFSFSEAEASLANCAACMSASFLAGQKVFRILLSVLCFSEAEASLD